MKMVIGMDVHSKATMYMAQSEKGEPVSEGTVTTSLDGFSEMVEKLGASPGTRIGLETGTQMTFVARILSSLGMAPVVIDAREVRQKARRMNQKSDRRDAFEICDGLRRGVFVSEVYVPDEEVHRLRRVLSRRRHFVNLCTSQVNAARFVLRSVGLRNRGATLTTRAAWEKMLSDPELSAVRAHLDMHYRIWVSSSENLTALDRELEEALKPFEDTEDLLRSVPGVGRICAATFIAALGRADRFAGSAQVASYAGLVPTGYDSGEVIRRGHITKAGSPELRAMLCEAAHQAARANHPLNPYWRRIAAKGGYKKAVVAVAHRLSRILFRMWRKRERFDVNQLNVVRDKVVRQKTYYYRFKEEPMSAQAR